MAALGNLQLVNGNASNKAAVVQAANRAKESKDPILQDLASRVISNLRQEIVSAIRSVALLWSPVQGTEPLIVKILSIQLI
jgi:hypothetical protein